MYFFIFEDKISVHSYNRDKLYYNSKSIYHTKLFFEWLKIYAVVHTSFPVLRLFEFFCYELKAVHERESCNRDQIRHILCNHFFLFTNILTDLQ